MGAAARKEGKEGEEECRAVRGGSSVASTGVVWAAATRVAAARAVVVRTAAARAAAVEEKMEEEMEDAEVDGVRAAAAAVGGRAVCVGGVGGVGGDYAGRGNAGCESAYSAMYPRKVDNPVYDCAPSRLKVRAQKAPT
mgnify:CR=1 FL=1